MYLKLALGYKVRTEKRTGQQPCTNNQILGLVKEGQRSVCLPLRHLCKNKTIHFKTNNPQINECVASQVKESVFVT